MESRDAERLAEALLIWRYTGHELRAHTDIPLDRCFTRGDVALRLAKLVGVRDEYLKAVFAQPVITVTVAELEGPTPSKQQARAKRGYSRVCR